MPAETATPRRSPALSSSCRRTWESTRSASKCTETWYRTAHVSHLHARTFLRDQLFDLLHEVRRRHVFRFFFPARTDVDPSCFGFLVPDHQQERHLLHGVLANLGVHLFVARIDLDANADGLQLIRNFVGILRMPLADGDHRYLYRRQPNRKRARVVLDEHTEESLDRSEQCAMHHHRLFARTILGDVLKAEALWQVEVDLDRRKLPQPPDRVHQLDIDLWPVKRRLARNGFVLDVLALQHIFERFGGVDPLLFAAHKILAVVRIPG